MARAFGEKRAFDVEMDDLMDNELTFRPDTALPRQYIVAQEALALPEGWQCLEFGGLFFHLSDVTPHRIVHDPASEAQHLVLGWPIGVDEGQDRPLARAFGRYVVFTRTAASFFCETDTFGSYPLVFHADRRIAASSPAALNRAMPLSLVEGAFEGFASHERAIWFPFGVTPFDGVDRLTPHHRLDLSDWQCTRIRRPGDVATQALPGDPDDIAEAIALAVRRNIESLAEKDPFTLLLTGGYDSRMVLAACRRVLARVETATIRAPKSHIDRMLAAQLAKRHGFSHREIELLPMTDEELRDWFERVGFCVRDAVAGLAKTAEKHLSDRFSVTGTGSDFVKSKHIRSGDLKRDDDISAREILVRYNLPTAPFLMSAAERWLSDLQDEPLPQLLDFLHIEARYGCWAAASAVGHKTKMPSISPFNSEEIRDLVFRLPYAYRVDGGFMQRYFNTLWPDLTEIPFNHAIGWRRLLSPKSELKALIPRKAKDKIKYILSKDRR